MKRLLILSLLLTACATVNPPGSNHPSDASQSEINMAVQMGITVQELRQQTPQQHMEMMMKMQQKSGGETGMKNAAPHPAACEGDGCSCHIAQAPDAPKQGGCGCGKTACNKAS